jgi:hypothetical protein
MDRRSGKHLAFVLATLASTFSTTGCFWKQAGGEAVEIDPYAPAEPAAPVALEDDSGPQNDPAGTANEVQNTGSDKPVPVDEMIAAGGQAKAGKKSAPAEEEDDPTTRDYSEAFNPDPGYKPAAPLAGSGQSAASTIAAGKARGSGARLMIITVDRINIRTSPDRRSRIVGELRKGDHVRVDIDESAGWAKLADGEFIRARHLKSAEN